MVNSDLLKRVNDHADMVARLSERLDVTRVFRFSTERAGAESCTYSDWSLCVEIVSNGRIEPEPANHVLLIRRPVRDLAHFLRLGQVPVIADLDGASWDCQEAGHFPVLVGVGEAVDMPEGILARVWLAVARLELLNLRQPAGDPAQAAAGVRGLSGANLGPIVLAAEEYREHVPRRELDAAGIGKGGDDVVECTPQVVYHVPKDDAEAWFRGLVGGENNIAPAGLLIDLTKPDRIRTVLCDDSRYFSLKRTQVL